MSIMKMRDSVNETDSKFGAHGTVRFTVIDNNTIIFRARGPFNIELFRVLEKMELEVLKEIDKEAVSWVEAIIFEHSCLATQELLSEFSKYLKFLRKNNLIPLVSAYVFKDEVEGAKLMPNEYKKCYDSAKMNFCSFDNEEKAIAHIRTYLPEEIKPA